MKLLNLVLTKLKVFYNNLRMRIPSRLPVGMSEFETWANDIISVSGKFADEVSMKFALATQILHLPAQSKMVPKKFFIDSLHKAAANQVASQVFSDIKQQQKEMLEKINTSVVQPTAVLEVTPAAISGEGSNGHATVQEATTQADS